MNQPNITDADLRAFAKQQLSDETRFVVLLALRRQIANQRRIEPAELIDLAQQHNARPAAALSCLGFVETIDGEWIALETLTQEDAAEVLVDSTDIEVLAGLFVFRSLAAEHAPPLPSSGSPRTKP